MVSRCLPRFVVAAPASGQGKTTVALGLMAALGRLGFGVSGHKVGPDHIDPGFHTLATGRPGRNLDPWLVSEDRLVPLLLHGAIGANVAVVDGMMGLHDGQLDGRGFASTAHVAAATRTPVLLVLDVSHATRSIGAVVRGMTDFDPSVEVGGVILNKVDSARHAQEVGSSINLPVLGVLPRGDGIAAPSRNLGLPSAQRRDETRQALEHLTDRMIDRIDMGQVMALADRAPDLESVAWDPSAEVRSPLGQAGYARPVVAVAAGRAFSFRYVETEELLHAAGCDVVTFDPLTDESLPTGTRGLYLGGASPELHTLGLSDNSSLRADLLDAVSSGIPTVAECTGLLYLCTTVDHAPMVGALTTHAAITPRSTVAYRRAHAVADSLLTRAGDTVTGHESHRAQVTPETSTCTAWLIDGRPSGFASPTLHASVLQTHWAGYPLLAQRFADAVHAARPRDGFG